MGVASLLANTLYIGLPNGAPTHVHVLLRPSSARLVEEMRAGVDPDMDPKELTSQQVVRLHQLLHEVSICQELPGLSAL